MHVHDPLGWWDDHAQPVSLDEILDRRRDRRGRGARARGARARAECVRPARDRARGGASRLETAFWRWPFQARRRLPGVRDGDAARRDSTALASPAWTHSSSTCRSATGQRTTCCAKCALTSLSVAHRSRSAPRRVGCWRCSCARGRDPRARGRHAVRLQRHLDGARAAARRAAGHDRDRDVARRRRRALVRARRAQPTASRSTAAPASTCWRRCPGPTTSRSSTPTRTPYPRVRPAGAGAVATRRMLIADNAIRAGRIVEAGVGCRHRRHPRDARPAGRRLRTSCRRPAGRRRAGGRGQAELSRDDVPAIAPPDVRRAGGDPVREVTRHIWGDPEAGEVADWIYASTEHVHALVFGLAPGTWFRHSPSSARSSAPTSCSTSCAGRWCSRIPRRARCCACRAAATRSSAATPGTTSMRTGTRSCACSSCMRRRPRPARRAPTRARSRTSSRPTGATATTRSSGTCREPSPRGGRCSSRRSSGGAPWTCSRASTRAPNTSPRACSS